MISCHVIEDRFTNRRVIVLNTRSCSITLLPDEVHEVIYCLHRELAKVRDPNYLVPEAAPRREPPSSMAARPQLSNPTELLDIL